MTHSKIHSSHLSKRQIEQMIQRREYVAFKIQTTGTSFLDSQKSLFGFDWRTMQATGCDLAAWLRAWNRDLMKLALYR